MSDGRRSGRSKKQIDYSALGDVGGSDDDFAESTPPPPKKQKKMTEKKLKTEKHEEEKENRKNKKALNRKTPEEIQFEEEVQKALEQSKIELNSSLENEDTKDVKTAEEEPVQHNDPSRRRISDEIEILEEPASTEVTSKRRSASKISFAEAVVDSGTKGDVSDDDDSYVDDNEDDSDSSYNGNDSDFDVGSKSKKSKAKKKEKTPNKLKESKAKPAAAITKTTSANSKTTVKAVNGVSKSVKTVNNVSKTPSRPYSAPTLSSPTVVSGLSSKKPAWTPPGSSNSGKSLGGVVIKSPSSGLRLGLSRNQRVKPLHPTLNIQH